MSINKNKNSVAKVTNKKGYIKGYLSSRDEEKGKDIELDARGFIITAL